MLCCSAWAVPLMLNEAYFINDMAPSHTGNEAFALGNFTAALGHYSRALQEEPHNATAPQQSGGLLPCHEVVSV